MIIYALMVTSCFAVPHFSDNGIAWPLGGIEQPILASPRERDWTERTVSEKSCHTREESLHKTQAKCLSSAATRIKELAGTSRSSFSQNDPSAQAVCETREVQE